MKKSIFFLLSFQLICLLNIKLTAQVAINTAGNPPNASAMLDVSSNSKGVLFPQVSLASLTDGTTIANPAAGLLVFNTNDALATGKGFYYNSGSPVSPVWVKLVTASTGWLTQGNSGINAASDFLGTTDGKPLNFRLNNTPWGSLDYNSRNISLGAQALHNNAGSGIVAIGDSALYALSGGTGHNVAIGSSALTNNTTGSSNIAIGVRAMYSNTERVDNLAIGDSALYYNGIGASGATQSNRNLAIGSRALAYNTTGYNNIGLGTYALYYNTIGAVNTAIGGGTLAYNTTGNYNSGFGGGALSSNVTGAFNTAIGVGALGDNTDGYQNTSVGYSSLYNNTIGIHNTGLGFFTGLGSVDLTNATAIGAYALVSSSNSMVLGSINGVNGASANTRVGIGINAPQATARLHVDVGNSTTDGVLVSGIYNNTGTVPDLAAGSRLMFYPAKAAFRAGFADATASQNSNVGLSSFAAGYSPQAIGEASAALGWYTTAAGIYSMSAGYFANASGPKSLAIGEQVQASGANSVALGYYSIASGSSATAIGNSTLATGAIATAMGLSTTARGYSSVAMGRFNDPIASSSTNTWVDTDPLLIVGNGLSDAARSNAIVVLKNGNTGIGINNPGSNKLQVFGNTQTLSLQVSNGSVFTKVQSGSVAVGSSGAAFTTVTIPFQVAFNSVPKIVCTIVNDDPLQTNANDTWVVSVRNISTTQCVVNIIRVDTNLGWASLPHVNWVAFTN